MSEDGTPSRTSERLNKGIPPKRLGFEEVMSLMNTPPNVGSKGASASSLIASRGTGPANAVGATTTNKASTSAAVSIPSAASPVRTTQSSAAAENTASSAGTNASLSANVTAKDTSANDAIKQLAMSFNRKMTEMQNEFQRQVHEMSRLFSYNNSQLQASMLNLQQEIVARSSSTNVTVQSNDDSATNVHPPQQNGFPAPSQDSSSSSNNASALSAENSSTVRPPQTNGFNSQMQNSENGFSSSSTQQWAYSKLVDLPKFGGNPVDWPMFERSFEDTNREFNYTNTRNIIRLRAALHGDAKLTVDSLLPYPESVPEIMVALKENFGRPEQIINSQVVEIRRIPAILSGNINSIIPFANRVRNMTAFIKYAKAEHRLCDTTLLSELVGKLPIEKQLDWAEHKENLESYASIEDFSKFLNIVAKRANAVADSLPKATLGAFARNPEGRYRPPEAGQAKSVTNKRVLIASAQGQSGCLVCNDGCAKMFACPVFKNMTLNERWTKVKALQVCFSCLKRGHSISKCFTKKKCNINGCEKIHNSLLHNNTASSVTSAEQTADRTEQQTSHVERIYRAEVNREETGILFQVVPIFVTAGDKIVNTFGFVDQGASHSMIESQLAKELGLTGRRDTLSLQWLGNITTTNPTERVEFEIRGQGEFCESHKMTNVYTVQNMNLPVQSLSTNKKPLKEIPVVNYRNAQPQVVIGLDYAHLAAALEVPIVAEGGPIAAKTRLGWIVYGTSSAVQWSPRNRVLLSKRRHIERLDDLEKLVKDYLASEGFGVMPQCKQLLSDNDQRAVAIMESTTRRLKDRYEVGMLWASKFVSFPDSFYMAKSRLEGMEKKMAQDKEFAQLYKDKISAYIAKGYARKLSLEEAAIHTTKTFYLPHFAVRNANKKGIRLVFDAAAEVDKMSLNKALISGPDLNQPLQVILFKFRQSPVAVCGDIREMFLQVAVQKSDQDCQRFLWRYSVDQLFDTYVMQRLTFGATCSPTLAQHVKNVNAKEFSDLYPRAVEGIVERHYVDDYVDCFEGEDEAIEVLKNVIYIHKRGGFELRNIVSNSERVLSEIENAEQGESVVNVNNENIERILGMYWSTKNDEFIFILKFHRVPREILDRQRKPTKREVLSLNMSIFDPFGILANFVISSKIILQQTWTIGLGWDEELPDHLYNAWSTWLDEIQKVQHVKVPRCYHHRFTTADSLELHIFCDASEVALAAVAYWRIIDVGKISVHFIAGKTKCAPLKYHSIPRSELQAAVMAVRLKETILNSHTIKPKKVNFWSDSTTVINWIRSDSRRYKQFVANRISEILDGSSINEWWWLPSEDNVADDGTRAKFPSQFTPNGRWTSGPNFLVKPHTEWPRQPTQFAESTEGVIERRSNQHMFMAKQVNYIVPNLTRFSNYSRLKRCTAWMLRFVANCNSKRLKTISNFGPLTADEELAAEMYLVRAIQKEAYPDEYAHLSSKQPISKRSQLLQFNPYMDDDGIIRKRGREENAPSMTMEAKRSIILPQNHQFTILIVAWYHSKWHHVNRNLIMNEIRQKFWVPSLRVVMKRTESNCRFCRIRKAKPRQPIMGLLPVDRLTPYVRPFTYSGVDFFGPVAVTVRRSKEKRWVALFTCLTTRAVHLELATDLSSDACLLCIRNFINRRGVPIQIRSDNGTNFVGLNKELRGAEDFMDHGAIQTGLSPLGIRWKFNCPANPSAGGIWERLVQSVKKVLYIMLKEYAPRVDTLISFLIEAENIVNSRPLTHLPVSSDDPEPLTPNHFLLNTTNSTQTPSPFDKKLLCLRKQWRIAQTLKNGFWKQWMLEYLPELTRRTKWCQPTEALKVGDLVIICEVELPRTQWKRGRVLRLYHGADDVVRAADVETSQSTLKRPTSKLAVLDVL